ncbi:hypothetical protein BDF20DRAFT_901492 [Mycotypha africana]|uniref:uncharacterized protein n=1 Tax=Mycotypha africana TaxID=64632 RepID=UPI0023009239|nr:uncharacterized protein BDF20DRAFT_901492 [Mycotypha africana]KAI8967254.1 hypothetical protein BDF20DRAFT_901492 [Mycotypha africana]
MMTTAIMRTTTTTMTTTTTTTTMKRTVKITVIRMSCQTIQEKERIAAVATTAIVPAVSIIKQERTCLSILIMIAPFIALRLGWHHHHHSKTPKRRVWKRKRMMNPKIAPIKNTHPRLEEDDDPKEAQPSRKIQPIPAEQQ